MRVLNIIKWVVFFVSLGFMIAASIFLQANEKDPITIFLFFFSLAGIFVSGILLCITAGAIGTPNNVIREEKLLPDCAVKMENGLFIFDIIEIESGVWELGSSDVFCKQRLDMKGWLKQKTYIARLIKLSLVLQYYNQNKQIAYTLPYGSQFYQKPTLFLRFKDLSGKYTSKQIVKNHKIKKGIYFRFQLRLMLSPGKGHWREMNLSHYPIALTDCYRIKSV